MNTMCLILAAVSALTAAPAISGRVVDTAGAPVQNARVFLECGLGSTLVEVRADASGAFRFDNPALGVAGIVAVADGLSFGGATVTVSVADDVTGVVIALRPTATVSGKIVDHKGKPVEGARVTRALLLGDAKVGIPFAKLKAFGFTEPVSDAEGRFTVPQLPEAASVALKASHPQYAQASVTDIPVGSADQRMTMYPGVLVRGQVLSRSGQMPVANAQITFTRAAAPFDSVLVRTGPKGDFLARLEPGPYVAQANSLEYRSPAGEKITITADAPEAKLSLYVAGTGALAGIVSDAVTGKPIDGAKLIVSANGSTAAHVFTGPTGEFRADAAEGDNVVTLDSAPGYLAPAKPALKVTVTKGQEAKLPTFWLAPIPAYKIQVVDALMNPVAGAVVTMLRPAQFGWRVSGADGRVDLNFASLPPDGTIVGLAEHATQSAAAVFSLNRANAQDAKVQLLSLARLEGDVVGRGSKRLPGAVVGAVFANPPFADTVLLWQTVSREDGRFAWDSAVPQAAVKCLAKASARKEAGEKLGESAPVTLEPGTTQDIGRIVVEEGAPAESQLGESLDWRAGRRIAGPAPDAKGPAVLIHCTPEEAQAVVEGLAVAQKLFPGIAFAAVVSGPYGGNAEVPVFQGNRPGPATTYVLGPDGAVLLETFGLPPVRALQQLRGAQP